MSSFCARIEIFPQYEYTGEVSYLLPFSYGCPDWNLMGYSDINELIEAIRVKLLENQKFSEEEGGELK